MFNLAEIFQALDTMPNVNGGQVTVLTEGDLRISATVLDEFGPAT